MNRVIFLESHLGSGSQHLFDILDSHPRIQGVRVGSYNDATDIHRLVSSPHKWRNNAAIFLDELLYNHSLGSRCLYRHAQHVFLVREPKGALNEIVNTQKYEPNKALRYYSFRLRRLCSIARAAGGVVLTHEDLCRGDGMDLVGQMLRLKPPLEARPLGRDEPRHGVPLAVIDEATEYFEKYLHVLRNCGPSSTQQRDRSVRPVG